MRQLILELVPAQPPTLENFATGGNAEALTGLAGWLAAAAADTCLFLWGDSGAGKTHRIKTQLADWVKRGLVRPERILAVTFTEAAASELRERIRAGRLAEGLVEGALAVYLLIGCERIDWGVSDFSVGYEVRK